MQGERLHDGQRAKFGKSLRQLAAGFNGAMGSALLFGSVATLIVATIISVFVSRRIVEPVRQVSRASTRIAAGHYGERLSETGGDERLPPIRHRVVEVGGGSSRVRLAQFADL